MIAREPQERGRLAPSPTGGLHVGHARTFLVAWVAARRGEGRVVLRVEDIDATRVRPGATEAMMLDLAWLGLDWDEGPDVGGDAAPYLQSSRFETYQSAIDRLARAELIYPCTCTRAEIERAASAPHAEEDGPIYPRLCAGRSADDARRLGDRPFAWRFRAPDAPIAWNDIFKGPVEVNPARVGGDFIVARSPFSPSYQLAAAVDDALMGITQVVRGDDLVTSTPRQILIHRAIGGIPPSYGHVPLVTDESGKRLAKRDDSVKLTTLREFGFDPESIIGWAARSLGWVTTVEPSRPRDWVRFGNALEVAPGPARFVESDLSIR